MAVEADAGLEPPVQPIQSRLAGHARLDRARLNHLRAKDINIEGFFSPKDIRNDGWPKSSARPSQVLGSQDVFDSVLKEATRRTHPDTNVGRDSGDFRNVMNARERSKMLKGCQ